MISYMAPDMISDTKQIMIILLTSDITIDKLSDMTPDNMYHNI